MATKPWEDNWNVIEDDSDVMPWEQSWVTQEDVNKEVATTATRGKNDQHSIWDVKKYESKRDPEKLKKNMEDNKEMLRKIAQGISFGFADEIEAGIRSAVGDREYKELRDEIRQKGIDFALENPKLSAALEIAGAIAIPGFGAARLAGSGLVKSAAYTGGQGALYGAGQADEMEDVAENVFKQGAIGTVSGGVLNKLGGAVAPKLAPGAKKLMNEGVELTPGQALGGNFNAWEEGLSKALPGINPARVNANKTWNKVIADKVIAPLGKKTPKNVTDINDMANFIVKTVDKTYDEALTGSKIVVDATTKSKLKNILLEAEESGMSKRGLAVLKKELNLYKRLLGKGVSNKSVKKVDQNLARRAGLFQKTTNMAESEAADFVPDIRALFKEELIRQNPTQGAKLLNVDKAYGDIVAIEGAIGSGTVKGAFTPSQLLTASGKSKTQAASRIKKATAQTPLQKSAKEAQELIGDTLPQSGTIPRGVNYVATGLAGHGLLTGSAITGGTLLPLLAIPGASSLLYSKGGQQLMRKWLNAGKSREEIAKLVKQYVTQGATSGLLTSMDAQ